MTDNSNNPLPSDPNQPSKGKKKGIIIAAAAAGAIAVGVGVLLAPGESPTACVYGPPVNINTPDTVTADTLEEPDIYPEPCVYGPPTYFEDTEDYSGQ